VSGARCCLALALVALSVAGCSGTPAPAPSATSFAAARSASGPVTIQGRPENSTVIRETGKPARFTLRESDTTESLTVVAPAGVTVPANLPFATTVTVSGTYDGAQRVFTATSVETQVPTRDQQPRG
jgi:hypothetical protein